jgi:hypothetical protein
VAGDPEGLGSDGRFPLLKVFSQTNGLLRVGLPIDLGDGRRSNSTEPFRGSHREARAQHSSYW